MRSLVPSRSIAELQGSYRVYVIDEAGKVEMRPVELGSVIDNLRLVEKGVMPGERVAVEIIKLQPGMTVRPRRVKLEVDGTIAESPEPEPEPGGGGTGAGAAAGASGDTGT